MLSGRRILVTGASSGIGRGLARAYAEHGAFVLAVGRRRQALLDTAKDLPIRPVVGDLTTDAGRRAVATQVEHIGGALDVVVHAAGLLGPVGVALRDYPEDQWHAVLAANLTAVHLLHQRVSGFLDAGSNAVVIGVSSTVGREARAGWGMYAISKHALEAWLSVLAGEWGVGRVYSVNPGATRTPMRASAAPDEDPTTLPTPADIAPLFLRLAHPGAAEPTGSRLDARDWIGRDPWADLA